MPLEKISLEDALALGIGEPSLVVYSSTKPKPKPKPSVVIQPLNQESENATIQNTDSKGLGRGNG